MISAVQSVHGGGCTFSTAGWLLLFLLSFFLGAQAQPSLQQGTVDLKLDDFLKRVLERNESVQSKLLETEVARRRALGEYGVFEPELFGTVEHTESSRQNTVEEQRNQLSSTFSETNTLYQGGIEGLVPSGARIRLGYTLRDLNNNLQYQNPSRGATNGEFQTFFGFSATQPLLKNAGFSATMAGIRVAALGSDIAFQEYRRQLMVVIGTAEASYWNLYLAQEQVRFFKESVTTAEKILMDSRARLQAGKSSQIEVLEAESGLALRRSKLSEAEQRLYDAASRVLSLYSETVMASDQLIEAVDKPQIGEAVPTFLNAWLTAYDLNPDYRIQRLKVMQEAVRLGFAKNQRLPEVNLKGSYGVNGLADTWGSSWDDATQGGYPAWTIGVELRIPLAGGLKTASELSAAKIRYQQAQLSLRENETQLANLLDTAMHKIKTASDGVQNYGTVVNFNQNLLDSSIARLEAGKLDSRRVLENDADLFEAKNAVVEALVQYQRAVLEMELMQGVVLKNRKMDLTQSELRSRTAELARAGNISDASYQSFIRRLQRDYERSMQPPPDRDTPEQSKARLALRERMAEWPATNLPPAASVLPNASEPVPVAPDPAPDALRPRNQELNQEQKP
jgi:outer membrane protein